MKNMMIALLVLCFTTTVGNTNEITTNLKTTVDAFKNTLISITKTISEDIKSIPEYQKANWVKGNTQNTKNTTKIKSWIKSTWE